METPTAPAPLSFTFEEGGELHTARIELPGGSQLIYVRDQNGSVAILGRNHIKEEIGFVLSPEAVAKITACLVLDRISPRDPLPNVSIQTLPAGSGVPTV